MRDAFPPVMDCGFTPEMSLLCFSDRLNVDVFTSFLTNGEHYSAIDKSVNSVVLTNADIFAGVVLSATLTFDNVACLGELSAEELEAESFAF